TYLAPTLALGAAELDQEGYDDDDAGRSGTAKWRRCSTSTSAGCTARHAARAQRLEHRAAPACPHVGDPVPGRGGRHARDAVGPPWRGGAHDPGGPRRLVRRQAPRGRTREERVRPAKRGGAIFADMVSGLRCLRRMTDDLPQQAAWPAVPFTSLSDRPMLSPAGSPPQLAVNGVSAAVPRRFHSSSSSCSSSTRSTESGLRRRYLAE
ncbi:hypothetical protein B0H17DRAFT_1074677, partial [Mycena rosella]